MQSRARSSYAEPQPLFALATCLREQSYEESLTQIPVMIHLGVVMIHL